MKKITNFLKTYWRIWLILLFVSALFLFFYRVARSVGVLDLTSLIVREFGILTYYLFIMGFLLAVNFFTFGRKNSKSWGVYRILGLFGVLFFSISLPFIFEGKKSLAQASNDPRFNLITLGLIFSILLFAVGEILLYLYNLLQNSNKNIDADKFNMTCPTCYGKGFVDLNDIKRLGMEKDWTQGYCRYCDGDGKVEKGKTRFENPLSTENHGWHELAKKFNKD
jgi:hypothetical protein